MTIVVVVRVFAITVYTVPAPLGQGLRTGDRVVVNKLARSRAPRRGDLIVFTVRGDAPAVSLIGPPQDWARWSTCRATPSTWRAVDMSYP